MDIKENPEYSVCPDCGGQVRKWNESVYECEECYAIFNMVKGELEYTDAYKESIKEDLEKADEVYQYEIDRVNTEIFIRQRFERGKQ